MLLDDLPDARDDNFNQNTTDKDEWLTPPYILAALGEFDLDPCAPRVRPWDMAKNHYTVEDNGLLKPWNGRVWLNPPYGKHTFRWMNRLSEHKNGIAPIYGRTDTIGFHRSIFDRATGIFFFKGRIRFHHVSGAKGGTGPAPSCLISYDEANNKAIANSGLDGKFLTIGGNQ